ncbi:MAG TPA: glycosyltransferase family 9 protein [Burkholderiales bacterium]|nr:glycosyltransferase family 9 protein [Burkholderiales bacterium]
MRAAIGSIAVFRALQLGDMLAAIPALRALRAWQPHARLVVIGLPWAQALIARYAWIDDFLTFPGHPLLPEHQADEMALNAFFTEARARRFDLAVQLHGSGATTNAVVAQLGARYTAGFHPVDHPTPHPERYIAWPEQGREVDRLMQLPLHLGAPRVSTRLDYPVFAADFDRLAAIGAPPREANYVIVHPGARLPSRRWPAARFAAVAHALREAGYAVVLTGSAAEADTLEAFRRHAPPGVIDLADRTDLGTLGALIERARLLVSNDTGVSHIAAARGTPSVVISCGADAQRWAPQDRRRHRVLAHPMPCRPCLHQRCPTAHECADAIEVAQVVREARRLLELELPRAA